MVSVVLRRVFGNFRYVQLAIIVAFVVLSAAILFPNREVVWQIFSSSVIPFGDKLAFLVSLYGALTTSFTAYSAIFTVSAAVLFGIDIALLVFYVRRRQAGFSGRSAEWNSLGGLISGVLGVGCAACGSVILTSIFGAFGAGGFLLLLPLHGAEFGLIGILFLLVSIYQLTKRINDPLVCSLQSSAY